MRIFKPAVLAILIAAAGLLPAGVALAHTLAEDGRISAFLHIAPDDKPRPGKVNTVHFYFNDQDFRFTMEGCFCDASVKEGRKVLFKGPLSAEGRRVGKLDVLLPDNNFSYDVAVSGTPKTAGFFQPFNLKFDIDVGSPPPEKQNRSDWPYLLVSGAIVISGTSALFYLSGKRRIKLPWRKYGQKSGNYNSSDSNRRGHSLGSGAE